MTTITPQELQQRMCAGQPVELIDVRTPVEFREVHAEPARNVPLDRLNPHEFAAAARGSMPLYVICRSGSRGRQACETLAAAGVAVVNVEGGTQAWERAGLPVTRGRKAISLERQVRIVAGGLALLGGLLALTAHPYWAGLSAFIGGGLLFAGVTDTCGMALVLARMPWNQVREPKSPAACRLPSESQGPGCCP